MERAANLRTRAGRSLDHFRGHLAAAAMAATARHAGWIADRSRGARWKDGRARSGAAFARTDFECRVKSQRRCRGRVPDLVCDQASLRRSHHGPHRDGRNHIHDSRGRARIAEPIRENRASAYFLGVIWSAARSGPSRKGGSPPLCYARLAGRGADAPLSSRCVRKNQARPRPMKARASSRTPHFRSSYFFLPSKPPSAPVAPPVAPPAAPPSALPPPSAAPTPPFASPPATPATSGTNTGFEVVPVTRNEIPPPLLPPWPPPASEATEATCDTPPSAPPLT